MTRTTVTIKQKRTSATQKKEMQIIWMALQRQSDRKSCWYAHVYLCCSFHSKTNKNITRKMASAESLTASLQWVLSNRFGFFFFSSLYSISLCCPFRFQSEFHYVPVCMEIFSIISTFCDEFLVWNTEQKQTVLMIQPAVCNFFCLMSFRFHFSCIAYKSSTFIRAE